MDSNVFIDQNVVEDQHSSPSPIQSENQCFDISKYDECLLKKIKLFIVLNPPDKPLLQRDNFFMGTFFKLYLYNNVLA